MSHTFLWLLTQTENGGYDTYDSCVVAAKTKEQAVEISPRHKRFPKNEYPTANAFGYMSGWAHSPDGVTAEKIGVAKEELDGKVIITSFNAG